MQIIEKKFWCQKLADNEAVSKEAVGSGKYMKPQNTDECLKKDWEIGNLQISES